VTTDSPPTTRVSRCLRALDTAAGSRVEQALTAHHRRRLERLGHAAALAAQASDTRARPGNSLEVLVDGAEALPEIARAIEAAQTSVWLAGWYFSPDFRLRRDRKQTLRELLAATAERGVEVRVLAWGGAPLPLFHPDRGEARQVRDTLERQTRIRVALDSKERPLHCHHEKLAVVDGAVAFVGGIDLTSYGGDRFDTHDHPARPEVGWHDATSRLRGPAVGDVAAHFRLRWHEVTGEELPLAGEPAPAGDIELQVVRTIPEKIYARLPRGEFTILESYLRALRAAQRLVYLENQFLWSPELASVLANKLRNPPDDDFRLLVLLPAKPNNGNDDTRGQVGVLVDADGGAGRFLACTLYQSGGAQPVYVHAKIGVVDDAWLTIGSANLNAHSLFNDTEMNVVTQDAALARETRLRLWGEHRRSCRRDRRRPDRRHRRTLAPAGGGPARAASRGSTAHAPGRPPPARVAPDSGAPRPDQRVARGRLSQAERQLPTRARHRCS
jgi:phosphatidylserine/phosphatidylglycerophosphate/cardiolipin synthase-like enzyme